MNIKNICIIGAGTMGNGIAQACAAADFQVTVVDLLEETLQRALATIDLNLDRQIKKGTVTKEQKFALLSNLKVSTNYDDLAEAQLVIEAATENVQLKNKLLRLIDSHIQPSCIIASNTSSLSITQLATEISRPQNFIGMHFFNPVPMMNLVEIIRGLQTSDETFGLISQLASRLGKTPITVGNRPGFVVNRILIPMINEAIFVLQDGLASAHDIDAGMTLGCNQPIGPLALADLIGLDTVLAILEALNTGFCDSKYRPAPLLMEMVAAGYLGRKSKRGFYEYK